MKRQHFRMVIFLFFTTCAVGCSTTGNYKEKAPFGPKKLASADTFIDQNEELYSLGSPQFNIPIVINKPVENFIRYFQTTNRRHFVRWLERSQKYMPMMQKILADNDLPTDLVYIAMIESGFSTSAYSHARAMGPWQFIQGTGKRYGLKINWWVDERRDPLKSTTAAAQYLKNLYDMFNSWFLAAAGYNAGENKIKRALLRHNTDDFWEIAGYRRSLKPETKQYVPKLIAAALIAKNPEKYGFTDISYEAPYAFDTVTVTEPTDLKQIAELIDVPFEDVRTLNPELLRWCTPPDVEEYTLQIPAGKKEIFEEKYAEIQPKEKTIFHTHQVRAGDSLYKIANTYRTQIGPIIEMNRLKTVRHLKPGQQLIIPVRTQI